MTIVLLVELTTVRQGPVVDGEYFIVHCIVGGFDKVRHVLNVLPVLY